MKHELGALPTRVQMFFSQNPDGNPQYIVGMMNIGHNYGYNVEMTKKEFIIMTAKAAVCVYRASGARLPWIGSTSGYYRFLAWK